MWSVGLKGFFIQYKFILPTSVKHSSYTYQKLFRALYGYSQSVSKSSGKTYNYHRPGVLSKTPFIKQGKNCVIIQPDAFKELISFFKTGKNPAHSWTAKGDWKAVYYLNEKELEEANVVSALENWVDRTYITSPSKSPMQLFSEMERLKDNISSGKKIDLAYHKVVLNEAQKIVSSSWFKNTYSKSPKLKQFNSIYSFLKG